MQKTRRAPEGRARETMAVRPESVIHSVSNSVSILVCTCNRAADLEQTLAALQAVRVPHGLSVELLIVDNGSTDHTAQIVQSVSLTTMPTRYLVEPRRGQCYARNTGLAAAQGGIILCTDDDIRLPQDWIAGMCDPILRGRADAVAGGVRLAPHLERPWLQPKHRSWLACTDRLCPNEPSDMVGANMAFARSVLDRVPAFDTELGPGAYGFGDETLFSWQLRQAGYNLVSAFDICVEHHCDSSRLTRENFISAAQKMGRSYAYINYHWLHLSGTALHKRFLKVSLKLAFYRFMRRHEVASEEIEKIMERAGRGMAEKKVEGITEWEMELVEEQSYYRQMKKEQQRTRRYNKKGLEKRAHCHRSDHNQQ